MNRRKWNRMVYVCCQVSLVRGYEKAAIILRLLRGACCSFVSIKKVLERVAVNGSVWFVCFQA